MMTYFTSIQLCSPITTSTRSHRQNKPQFILDLLISPKPTKLSCSRNNSQIKIQGILPAFKIKIIEQDENLVASAKKINTRALTETRKWKNGKKQSLIIQLDLLIFEEEIKGVRGKLKRLSQCINRKVGQQMMNTYFVSFFIEATHCWFFTVVFMTVYHYQYCHNIKMLVDSSSISAISVTSKNKSIKSKNSPSTSIPESPQLKNYNSQSYDDYWTSECETMKVHSLQQAVQYMQKTQEEMEKKFQQCIESMLAEIQRNNENNSRLATEVTKLKTEVMESKKDILIIEEFLQSSAKKEVKRKNGLESKPLTRIGSSRDLIGSGSLSRNILGRRATSKFFKSKLLMKA